MPGTKLDFYDTRAGEKLQPGAYDKLPYISRMLAENLVRRCSAGLARRIEQNLLTKSSMSTLRFVKQPYPFDSKNNDTTQNVALDEDSEPAATRDTLGQFGKGHLGRTWWKWTNPSEYDWMDEHWPFNDSD